MEVRFWGTRGSIATPGPDTVRYGGNTSCVEVLTGRGTRIILDGGTGIRLLGARLMAEGGTGTASAGPRRAATGSGAPGGHLLISHTHWDHIQGLPFFPPLFQPGSRWDVYGPRGLCQSIADTLAGQMNYDYFPVSLEQLAADIAYHDLVEGAFCVDEVAVTTQYLNHPALTLGYRLEADGCRIAYLSDHEPFDPALAAGGDLLASPDDARHVRFMAGADLVIHDAQYTAREYADRRGWGHSTVEYAVAAARLAGAGKLVLFHHDPGRSDGDLDEVLEALAGGAGGTEVIAAAEGQVLGLAARRESAPSGFDADAPAVVSTNEPEVRTVLAALPDGAMAGVVRSAAEDAGLDVERMPAVWFGELAPSSVVVMDCDQPDAEETLARLAHVGGDRRPVVLAVTRHRPPLRSVPGVTEWLVWPASPAHVKAKLQAAALGRSCRWQNAPRPANEEHRLRALHHLGVLDTGPEARFDRITRMARERLGVPIARISLVDRDRQWFKSSAGAGGTGSPRDESICAHAILEGDVFQVPDLRGDDRFADSPVVNGSEHVRFYAAAALVLPDGSRVGTLCVEDRRPRLLDDGQLAELKYLADLVCQELLARP